MTIPTKWPDPERPGLPMFPERDGKHVIDVDPGGFGSELVYYWLAEHQVWVEYENEGPDDALDGYDLIGWAYVGPCLTPAQIAEMLAAERERCSNVCKTLNACEESQYGVGLKTTSAEERIKALAEAQRLIRNLGAAP